MNYKWEFFIPTEKSLSEVQAALTPIMRGTLAAISPFQGWVHDHAAYLAGKVVPPMLPCRGVRLVILGGLLSWDRVMRSIGPVLTTLGVKAVLSGNENAGFEWVAADPQDIDPDPPTTHAHPPFVGKAGTGRTN